MTKAKTPAAPAAAPADTAPLSEQKGLPIFTMSNHDKESKEAPRRIVFDFELGAVLFDSKTPGHSVVNFGGCSYEIAATLEEAVDELLAVTVVVQPAPVNVQHGEGAADAPQADQVGALADHQEAGTGQEQS